MFLVFFLLGSVWVFWIFHSSYLSVYMKSWYFYIWCVAFRAWFVLHSTFMFLFPKEIRFYYIMLLAFPFFSTGKVLTRTYQRKRVSFYGDFIDFFYRFYFINITVSPPKSLNQRLVYFWKLMCNLSWDNFLFVFVPQVRFQVERTDSLRFYVCLVSGKTEDHIVCSNQQRI